MELFGQKIAAIGQDGRQRHFDQMVVDTFDQFGDSIPEDAADENAAHRYFHEIKEAVNGIQRSFQGQGEP